MKRLKHDQLTFGCTLRDLKDYIESKGGKVVAVTALLPSRYGTSLRPTNEQINELTKKGITNEQLKQLGIADGFTGLTKREAEQLLILAKPRGVRGTTQGRTTVKGGDEGNDAEVQTEVEAVNGTDSEAFKTWILNDKIAYVDKKKALHWIEELQPHAETEQSKKELLDAAKIIKGFDISKLSNGKIREQRKISDTPEEKEKTGRKRLRDYALTFIV